jgi:PKHD-type hydroxylase
MPFFLLRPALLGQLSVDNFLSRDECSKLIDQTESKLALVAGKTEDHRAALRRSDIAWFSPDDGHQWLFERIKECVSDINRNWFGYNLTGFEGIQFTKYASNDGKAGDFFATHKDSKLLPGGTIRKLSFTIQLCEEGSYGGGDVVLYDSLTDCVKLSRALGSISFFPSYTIHEVTPVTVGTRYSLVGWACGPAFV